MTEKEKRKEKFKVKPESIFLFFKEICYFFFLKFLLNIIDLQCCIVSEVQQSDLYIYINIYIIFYIFFHYRLLQDIEYIFL